jgi:predicted dinucleotide-utilizing enzyme
MKAKELGIAVVGSGRIGTLRARLAAKHPAVRFLAVSDEKVENAKALADLTGADFYSTDNNEVIARPEVTAVFVSTPEGEHAAPVCKALELGKPVLVENPLVWCKALASSSTRFSNASRDSSSCSQMRRCGHARQESAGIRLVTAASR